MISEISYRVSGSNGMLHGLTSGFINQSKTGTAFLILYSCAILLILVPVLQKQPTSTTNTRKKQPPLGKKEEYNRQIKSINQK